MTLTVRLLLAAALVTLVAAVPARAGTFPVRTCGDAPAGAPPVWTFATTDAATIGSADGCADGSGLQVFEQLGPGPLANLGDEGWWTFEAPQNTRIVAARLRRYLHTYSDAGWIAETRADATVLDHCHVVSGVDCYFGTPSGRTDTISNLDAARLRIGGFCVPEGGHVVCERGASLHSLETFLYAATITLSDQQPPTSSLAATGLADGAGWKTSAGTITSTASDNTGVRRRDVRIDGTTVTTIDAPPAAEGGCRTPGEGLAYSFKQPCLGARGVNGERTDALDPRSWPQGIRELEVVAVDTGGAETASEKRAIRIDTQAPPPPGLDVAPGWTHAPAIEVTPSNPGGGSPLREVVLTACWTGTCHTRTEPAVGAPMTVAWPDLPDGAWSLDVRARDEAGHLSGQGTEVELRVDRTPPAAGSVRPSGGTYAPGTRLRPELDASDATSGIERVTYELSVDGGAYRLYGADVVVEAGHSYRIRAVAHDKAGNSTVREGETFGAIPPSIAPPAPGPSPTPPVAPAPPACKVRIASARPVTGGRLRVRGTVRAGRRVTLTLTRGRRHSTAVDRTTTSGRFDVRLRRPRGAPRRATLRARAPGCTTATRRLTLR